MKNQEKYNEKDKRFKDAIAMKEPDRVPMIPHVMDYFITRYGYTMADVMYNPQNAKEGVRKYNAEYDPDVNYGYVGIFAGLGSVWDKIGLKYLQWAGQKDSVCGENSVHQFVEKEYLTQEEYPEMLSDFTGWMFHKYLPRNFECMKPMANFNGMGLLGYASLGGIMQFLDPEIPKMFQTLHEAALGTLQYFQESGAFDQEMREAGYPLIFNGSSNCPFDMLSDYLRGTIGTMLDLYDEPEQVHETLERFYPAALHNCLNQTVNGQAQVVFIPLHKGLEGFMSNEQYKEFYWPTLKRLVEDIVQHGHTPYIYTEGKYDARLEFLQELPAGKVLVHFEDCDMKEAKRIVGNKCCITGGFKARLLATATPEIITEEVKKMLDICAPGGGYMFDLDGGIDSESKPENVAALFEAVRKYGCY